jgi:hypothetical protein
MMSAVRARPPQARTLVSGAVMSNVGIHFSADHPRTMAAGGICVGGVAGLRGDTVRATRRCASAQVDPNPQQHPNLRQVTLSSEAVYRRALVRSQAVR